MTDRQFDLALLGATGYTGQLALDYLGTLPPAARGRVAVAGRSPEKVAAACRRLAPDLDATVLTADATDPASLSSLAASCRALVNLAGPYADRGPQVVQACVEHGTHYVDLTGEPLFVRDMIAAHHTRAQQTGARIVHSAGFESLPFDMLTLLVVDALRQRHGVPCARLDLSVRMKIRDRAVLRDATLSGGTVATILNLLADTRGAEMVDPAVLLPADVDPAPIRARHPRPRGARRDPFDDSWATPVFPAPTLNPQVILRSAALHEQDDTGYGPDFTYRESMSMAGAVGGAMQHAAAVSTAAVVDRVVGVIEHGRPWQRRALGGVVRRVGARSGEGPRHDLLDSFDYSLVARATGPRGESVIGHWDALGNPGYRSTARMVIQAGLALAHDGHRLPARSGVLTPATALGPAFVDRLPAAAVTLGTGSPSATV